MKKKHFKVIALTIAILLIIGLGIFANALLGNPISKKIATNTAQKHLAETYADTDYYMERITYSFKDGKYHAFINSPTSIDTSFSLTITMLGELRLDTYEDVVNGFNTARRVDSDYRELTDSIFENPSFPYSCRISYGTLEIYPAEAFTDSERNDIPTYAINQTELELDKIYDIRELGKQSGHLIIYVENDTVTMEIATEIILDIKAIFDDAGIPFKALDFTLQYPRPEEGKRSEGKVSISDFPYEEIYEEGMLERVQEADKVLKAYYESQDLKDK